MCSIYNVSDCCIGLAVFQFRWKRKQCSPTEVEEEVNMNRFKNHLIVAAVLGALALTGIVMNSRQAVAQGPSGPGHVTVEAPLPLPVTGPVTLSGPVDSPDTVLVLDQQVTVAGTSTPPVGPIDVSGFKEIRVVVYAPFVAFGVGIQGNGCGATASVRSEQLS